MSSKKSITKLEQAQGTDVAHLRVLSIEAFKPCMDAVQKFSVYGKGSTLLETPVVSKKGQTINPYLVLNKQINAACQMEKADDPNASLRQRLARTNILFAVAETLSNGMDSQIEREEVKRIRDAAITEEASRLGLGNKKSVAQRNKSSRKGKAK